MLKDMVKEDKDAIHMPVMRLNTEDKTLQPGQKVIIQDGSTVVAATGDTFHGVVDPFSFDPVDKWGEVMVMIKPDLITKLSHNWEFDDYRLENATYDECRAMGCN
jgi:hypothetical protein